MPLYIRRPQVAEIVEAEQVGPGAHSYPQGTRPARPGDWIVTNHATGETRVLNDIEFSQQYQPAPVPSHLLSTVGTPAPEPGMTTATYEDGTSVVGPEPLPNVNWANSPRTDNRPAPETSWQPQAEAPVSQPPEAGSGDQEPFLPTGPATPMNEGLPGRPAPTADIEPRLQEPGPITTPTGQVGPKEEVQPAGSAVRTEPTNPQLTAAGPNPDYDRNYEAAGPSPEQTAPPNV